MSLDKSKKERIEFVLKNCIREKFQKYSPEPSAMPFHVRLLGKDRLALYQFIHSLNTTFGTSVFEPVAYELAKENFKEVQTHFKVGEFISEIAQIEIQNIINSLITASSNPDKELEIKRIQKVCKQGTIKKIKPTIVDIFLKTNNDELFLFDIKTAKPNIGGFKEFKRTLLEWTAVNLFENPNVKINTLIAIPYNPYEPEPYNRWTIRGMLDLEKELKVADEFWDFLGGPNAYNALLDCFENVGIQLREEIDKYFLRFR